MKKYLNKNIYICESKNNEIEELSRIKHTMWETTYRGIYYDFKIDNFDYEYNANKFLKLINSKNIFLYSIYDNNKLIGYFSYGELMRPYLDYEIEIGLLYILKRYQNLGIGKLIFNYCYNTIKNKGFNEFIICCNKYNIKAQKFYLRMGGSIIRIDDENEDKSIPQIVFLYKII